GGAPEEGQDDCSAGKGQPAGTAGIRTRGSAHVRRIGKPVLINARAARRLTDAAPESSAPWPGRFVFREADDARLPRIACAEQDTGGRTAVQRALQLDLPAEALAQPAHDRQAQAGAPRRLRAGAVEPLEGPLQGLDRHADAGIA